VSAVARVLALITHLRLGRHTQLAKPTALFSQRMISYHNPWMSTAMTCLTI